jgi:hypothetical protein
MNVGIMAMQITFKGRLFMLAFKRFKLGIMFDTPFYLKYVIMLRP